MRLRPTVLYLLLAAVIVGATPPAGANGIKKTDGNDTKGPLDLAVVKVKHVSGGSGFLVKTLAPFSSAQLDGDHGWIEVDFDVNGDRDIEYWVVVFYYKGRIRAVQGKGRSAVRLLPVARPNASSVKFKIKHSYLGSPKSYDFAALSFYLASPCSKAHPCVDAIPNRYPLIRHDLTAPTIKWGKVPLFSSNVSATLTFPVMFSVKDDTYGSGVKTWALQRRVVGTSTWTTVKTGTALTPTVQVTGEEGASYDFRIVALDRQKNKSVSPKKRTTVPWDDRNMIFIYTLNTTTDGVTGAFRSTTTSVANTGTIDASLPVGTQVCILGGPTSPGTSATANLALGGTDYGPILEEDDTTAVRANIYCVTVLAGIDSVTITVTSAEPFVFDGLILRP